MIAIEGSEFIPVESCQPFLRAKPQIPIGSLCDGVNRVLRESLLLGPDGCGILRQGLVRIERGDRIQSSKQNEERADAKHSGVLDYAPAGIARGAL